MISLESTIEALEKGGATLVLGNGSTQNKPLTDVRSSGTAILQAHSAGSGRKGSALIEYVPLWQQISGLRTETMDRIDYAERLIGLRKLNNEFERMLREELRIPVSALVKINAPCVAPIIHNDEKDNGKDGGQGCPRSIGANSHLAERTFLWDPLPKICLMLGISRSALSRLSKEFSGMSAHDVMDRIRAETVKAKMRQDIMAGSMKVFQHAVVTGKDNGPFRQLKNWPHLPFPMAYYKMLKRSRIEPEFDRGTWVISFGFPNYARFRRACLLRFGMTPQ